MQDSDRLPTDEARASRGAIDEIERLVLHVLAEQFQVVAVVQEARRVAHRARV